MPQEKPKKRVKGKAAVEALKRAKNRGNKPREEPYGRKQKKSDLPMPPQAEAYPKKRQMTKKIMKKPK